MAGVRVIIRKDGVAVKTTNRRTANNFEEVVANAFGCHRTPLSGMVNTLTKSDIMHEQVFAECKLRADFLLYRVFRETQQRTRPLIPHRAIKSGERASLTEFREDTALLLRISNYKKYSGDLVVFDHVDIFNIAAGLKTYTSTTGAESHMVIQNRVSLGLAKADGLVTLYKSVAQKAALENKIPFLAIKMKYKPGWLVICNQNDVKELSKFYHAIGD